ncbi:MAG: DUF4185 domain-containing protein, partial [Mucilaginibacter sp.]
FGDSYIDQYDEATKSVPCLFNANNSVLVQPKGNWDWHNTLTQPGNRGTKSFFYDDAKNFIWPMTGFQQGDTVYIYCINLRKTGSGQYDMKNMGNTWAKIYMPTMKIVGYSKLQNMNEIGFAQGFINDPADKYLYTHGLKDSKIYVARIPKSNVNGPWQFWDGSNWQADINKIAVIANAPGFSVHFSKIKGKYLFLSSEFSMACDNGKDIYAATSNNVTGPFTARKVIYTVDDKVNGHLPFFYGALAHPEYINDKNELLINYSINGYAPCVPGCVEGKYNPDFYRPRAIRVPLSLLDIR